CRLCNNLKPGTPDAVIDACADAYAAWADWRDPFPEADAGSAVRVDRLIGNGVRRGWVGVDNNHSVTMSDETVDQASWLTPGVRGIGTASFFADVGHEVPTALLPSLLTTTLGAPA